MERETTLKSSQVHETMARAIHSRAAEVAKRVTSRQGTGGRRLDLAIDEVLTSRRFGIPLMLLLLAGVFWITIEGANVPSAFLAKLLFRVEGQLASALQWAGAPPAMVGFVAHGVFKAVAWVVSVMLPPMAIFFPIFTLLEDLGYLPRVAFNLDHLFRRVGAHGKQALTMTMGFGCNAAGVISTRIIESRRERLIAIITNNFVPCNGRWPTLIMVSGLFVAVSVPAAYGSIAAVVAVVGATLVGVAATLIVSKLLSSSSLKGEPSGFQLELPPYRKPAVLQVLYTSFIDRTLFVLGRALVVAAPAGAVIWILANTHVHGASLFAHIAEALQPIGWFLGLDGVILLAFLVAIPANEIVVPTILMGYLATGEMTELENMRQLQALLTGQGWTLVTAVSLMLFSVLHYPCSTTTWSIWKETRSVKWTLLSNLIPLAVASGVCAVVANLLRLVL